MITLCHNSENDETVLSHHQILGSALNPFEVSNQRPSFKEGSFYQNVIANEAYSQKSQVLVVGELVGSNTLANYYIRPAESLYFARGHLAPDGDFVHVHEQNATYYYINVIPQWQSINNGNWKVIQFIGSLLHAEGGGLYQ